MGHDGSSRNDLVRFEIAIDAGARGNHDLIADHEVIGQSCLSPDHDVMAHASAAGDSDLRDDDRMGADRDVMGDLDQVVDLGALLDDCLAQCGAIDRHIRAQFNIVFDRDPAKLGNLVVPSLILHIAETVASDDRATVHDDPGANRAAFSDDDVRIEEGIVSNGRIVADKHAWVEHHSRTDCDPVSQSDARPDRDILADFCILATDHRLIDAARRHGRAKEGCGSLRKG